MHSATHTVAKTHTHTGHQQSTKHNKAYFEAHLFEPKMSSVSCFLFAFPLKEFLGFLI